MGRKDEQLAKSLLQDYDWLRRIDGIFILNKGRLCVVSRPDRENWNLKSVYRFLLSEEFSDAESKRVFHARDVVPVDVSFLARWQYHEKRLSIATLDKLIKSGVGPVKNLQGTRWKQRVAYLKSRFELLKVLFHEKNYGHFVLQPRKKSTIDNDLIFDKLNFYLEKKKPSLL